MLAGVINAHDSQILTIGLAPNGGRLASGAMDGSLREWGTADWNRHRQLNGHTRSINAVHYTLDGSILATGGTDNRIHLWNTGTGEQVGTLNSHTDNVTDITQTVRGRLLSSSYDTTVRRWDLRSQEESLPAYDGHEDDVVALAHTTKSSNDLVVSGGIGSAASVWNADTLTGVATLPGHTEAVVDIIPAPEQQSVLSISYSGEVFQWGIDSWECEASIDVEANDPFSLAVNPEEDLLIVGAGSRIHCLSIPDLTKVTSYTVHNTIVNTVAVGTDGSSLIAGCADGTLRIWALKDYS